jgi:sec-independent protein translocase protein TatC
MAIFKNKGEAKKEMSFLDHLEELRWHIVRALLGSLVFVIIAFLNRTFIFDKLILGPKSPEFFTNRLFGQIGIWLNQNFGLDPNSIAINTIPIKIVNIEMSGQFISHFKVSLVTGLILASPYIIYEIWSFIKPALYEKEQKHASGAVIYMTVLFLLGILFGYYLITPLSLHFLGSYIVSSEVENTIKLSSYIGTVTSVTFASGVIFELPMVVFFLSKIGMMTPEFMQKYRRHAYVVLLIVAAIITPPDVFSQTLVFIPLMILYEASVFVSRSVVKKKLKLEARENQMNSEKSTERTFIDGSEKEY